jgi:transcriptional regulator with XRE-family HTH domain
LTAESTSVFDVTAIRSALHASGLAISDVAFRVDIAVRSLQRILNGEPDPGEIRVATLARLADTLGLPLRSLFASPGGVVKAIPASAPPDDTLDPRPDDATTVIALLYDRGQATINSEVASALGWSLDRLKRSLTEADRRLRTAGLRVIREHGESSIRPVDDHAADRAALENVQAHARGLKTFEYKAAYALHTGDRISAQNEARRRFVVGRLANVGVISLTGDGPALSAAASFAHPLAAAETSDDQPAE